MKIGIAATQSEKEAVYRLRYEVYVEEMRRPCHADHEMKRITDFMDERGILLFAEDQGRVVATMRVNFRADGPIEFEEEYAVERFADYHPRGLSTTSKLMVLKEHRDCRLMIDLAKRGFQLAKESGIVFDFINANPPLDRLYRRLGYRTYEEDFVHPEFGRVVPMVMALDDVEHLEDVGSPFADLAARYPRDPRSVALFGEIRRSWLESSPAVSPALAAA